MQSLSRHRNFENFMFRKTPQNPAQCKLEDHETIITKLDNENDTGRFSENMRRHKECHLVQGSEGTLETR